MAPKSRRPSKKRPSMKTAKRMVTKQAKSKAKRNMDTFFFKSKVTATITPTQGVAVSNYIYNNFTLDPSGQGSAYIYNAEFNLYRLQYDKFRVNSVKVTFIPKANVLDVLNAQNDATANLTGDGAIHTCVDRDGPAPDSVAKITRYPSYRKCNLKKTWSRSYSVKYPTGVWLDCQNPSGFSMTGALGLSGGVTIYAENVVEDNYELWNEPWASVLVEHNIVFQGKTSNSLTGTYDEGGNLLAVTIAAENITLRKAVSPLKNVRGTLKDDTLTTNEITEVSINDRNED